MLRLGGEFTVMLCVSAPSGQLEPLRTALHEDAQKEFGDLYIHTKEIGGKGMTGEESPASTTTSLPSSQSDSVRQMIRRQATVGHWRADRATPVAQPPYHPRMSAASPTLQGPQMCLCDDDSRGCTPIFARQKMKYERAT